MNSPTAILAKFDKNQIKIWINNFKAEFYRLNEEERKKFSAGEIPFIAMTPEKVTKVLDFADKCTTAFQVEAMEKMICQEYIMPETFKEIEDYAEYLMNKALTDK